MKHTRTSQSPEKPGWLWRARRWLSDPGSEVLPPIFGDAVPPDLKVLEAEVEEARHTIQEVPAQSGPHDRRSKPARHRKSSVGSS